MKRLDIDRNTLKTLYIDRQYNQDKTAKILHCSQWVISNRLKLFNVETRPKTCNLTNRKYTYNKDFLKNITPDISWVLGLLVSDGFVSKNVPSAYFGLKLKQEDKDAVFKAKKVLKYTGPILTGINKLKYKGVVKEFRYCLLKISDIDMVKKLKNIGIKENKTLNETFLKCIAETKNEGIISSFIRGIYDGDGSLLYDKKRNSMCFQIVGTSHLLNKIQKYLIHYCYVNKTALTRNIPGTNHYALRYRGNLQTLRILNWIYKYSNSSDRMGRKFNNFCKTRRIISK